MMLTRDEMRGGTAAASAGLLETQATADSAEGWLARLWARLKKDFVAVVENRMSMERRQLAHRFKND